MKFLTSIYFPLQYSVTEMNNHKHFASNNSDGLIFASGPQQQEKQYNNLYSIAKRVSHSLKTTKVKRTKYYSVYNPSMYLNAR